MNRLPLMILAQAFSLVAAVCSPSESSADEAKAIAVIRKLGGAMTVDENSPGKPVISVDFTLSRINDGALGHLQGLSQLRSLVLSDTPITGEGLEHLRGLREIRALSLAGTRITDAGLTYLKALPQLESLDLGNTQIADAGLAHLKPLARLRIARPAAHQGDWHWAGNSSRCRNSTH